MFEKLEKIATLQFELVPQGGFTIASGDTPIDPSLPDISFMRTYLTEYGMDVPYVPGSSLKGTIRSYAEGILRSEAGDRGACDLARPCLKEASRDRRLSPYDLKERACLACQTFGGLSLSSVVRFSDLFPFRDESEIEGIAEKVQKASLVKNGIAINRNSGTVLRGALVFYESLQIPFYGDFSLKNYEEWQMALVLLVIDHINLGMQKMGFAKSRGNGKVQINFTGLTLVQKPGVLQVGGKQIQPTLPGLVNVFELDSQQANQFLEEVKSRGMNKLRQKVGVR